MTDRPSSADRRFLVRWCSFGSDTLEADQFQLDIQARLDSVTLRTDSRGHPDPDWMASEKRSKLRPHSVRSDIPDQTGRHQTGHSNSAGKASDRTFQLERTASDQTSKLRPDCLWQVNPIEIESRRARRPSPERALPWAAFPQTNHPSSDETATAKTGQHQEGHPSSYRASQRGPDMLSYQIRPAQTVRQDI